MCYDFWDTPRLPHLENFREIPNNLRDLKFCEYIRLDLILVYKQYFILALY